MVDFNDSQLNAAITTGTSPSLAELLGQHRAAIVDTLQASIDRDIAASLTLTRPAQLAPVPIRRGSGDKVRISFEVYAEFAPALRSAVEEISNDIGGRLTGSHRFAKEQALTDAAVGLAALRVAITAKVPAGDPNYV